MFANQERQDLLRWARGAIAHRLAAAPEPAPPQLADPALRAGAFVSVHLHGNLRGCIGQLGTTHLLVDVVRDCAVAAATGDPRFAPLRPDELADAQLEISVLGPIEPVTDVSDIEIGRHGLIVEQGFHRGLLLPQVAIEHQWGRDTFLAHTCLKAGLKADAWKTGARISRFEAEVFGEDSDVTVRCVVAQRLEVHHVQCEQSQLRGRSPDSGVRGPDYGRRVRVLS